MHLGPTEFRLLRFLLERPGRVFSREQLLDAVWGRDVEVELRTVDVHIRRLRKALNDGEPARPRSAPCAPPATRSIPATWLSGSPPRPGVPPRLAIKSFNRELRR